MSKLKFFFKDEHIVFIIEKVQMAPFIWNPNSVSYKNKSKKHIFWTHLVEDLNSNFPNDGNFVYSKYFDLFVAFHHNV